MKILARLGIFITTFAIGVAVVYGASLFFDSIACALLAAVIGCLVFYIGFLGPMIFNILTGSDKL